LNDGLHQAVEKKEGAKVEDFNANLCYRYVAELSERATSYGYDWYRRKP
jgi:hypothetical protein